MTSKAALDQLVVRYETKEFVSSDPISIPHAFDDPRDIEVIGLFAASLAWGQRVTILNKMADLCERMSYRPYDFILNIEKGNRIQKLNGFKHRTFQAIDALWFSRNLSSLLRKYGSIENAFCIDIDKDSDDEPASQAIEGFSTSLLSINLDTPHRLRKHLARPSTGSACKRLNMYLRWMVRPGPVDFGIWTGMEKKDLLLPLDIHCGTQAREMGYLIRNQNDWKAVIELSENCRKLDPDDPSKYDFAFFGSGVSRTSSRG